MKDKGLVFLNEPFLHIQGYSSQEPNVSFGEGCIADKNTIVGKVYILDVVTLLDTNSNTIVVYRSIQYLYYEKDDF